MDGADRRQRPEDEGADDAVAQRRALLLRRQAEDQHRQHHRVVGAQQAFEQDEQGDGEEIGREQQDIDAVEYDRSGSRLPWSRGGETVVDTTRINVYT